MVASFPQTKVAGGVSSVSKVWPRVDELAEEVQLALAYAPRRVRPAFRSLFRLDARLGQIVARASEPMLAQLRLAWWRDELGKPPATRPEGDPVLDEISANWAGQEQALIAMVDGWERLLEAEVMSEPAFRQFADGRAAPLVALARAHSIHETGPIELAARRWAMIDLMLRTSRAEERAELQRMIEQGGLQRAALPRTMRPLAVLDGLACRAATKGEGALLGSRGASLAALRLGIFGR